MPRRKAQRWLPDHVTPYKDRHGRTRYRYRKTGEKTYHFKAEPGTPEFLEELGTARAGGPIAITSSSAIVAGSMDDLARKLFAAPRWLRMKPSSQYTYRRIIERYLARLDRRGVRYGTYPAKRATVGVLDAHIAELADTPASANNLRKALKRLFDYAMKLGWITTNPATLTDSFGSGPGFHTWTDEEIQRYRAHHALGTMARVVLEVALNTAARRCNLAEIEREHLRDGRWYIDHAKGTNETSVVLTKEARAAIEALPASPIRFLIVSQRGTPYTIESLGNRFRKWADEAGCPGSLHGLRKAISRQLAECGATDAEGRSVTGHKKNATFAHYAAKADRTRLADTAMRKLIGEPDLANPPKG
jgi:site-specific recombinase XerD